MAKGELMQKGTSTEAADVILRIRRSVSAQLKGARRWMTGPRCTGLFRLVAGHLAERLDAVDDLISSGRIRPHCQLALSDGEAPISSGERLLRVGVYPLAANPMHWGHVLVGLTAVISIGLDKVVFIIAGSDRRKLFMVAADSRHRLGRSVIEMFHPLFAYSPLAFGTEFDGETNLGRLLRLNLRSPMDAFYIAGADHYRRTTPAGEADTIAKLERLVEDQGGSTRQTVSAVFVDRDAALAHARKVDTFLNVHLLPSIPMSVSSTAVRRALCADQLCEASVSLPYSCLVEIRAHGLYAAKGQ